MKQNKEPRNWPTHLSQLNLAKGKGNEEKMVFLPNGAGTEPPHTHKVNLDTDLILFIKVNSKLIIALTENAKLLNC